jgi:hypothetical protein
MRRSRPILRWTLALTLSAGMLAVGQGRRPGRGESSPGAGRQSKTQQQNSPAGLLPTFAGTIHGVDSKLLTLDVPGENLLEFHCSKKTRYWDGAKKLKSADFKPGTLVAVEARRFPDGSLDAVNVRIDRPKPAPAN